MMFRTGGASPYYDELRRRREEDRSMALDELRYERRLSDERDAQAEERAYAEQQYNQRQADEQQQALGREQRATDRQAAEDQKKQDQAEREARAKGRFLKIAAGGGEVEFPADELPPELGTVIQDDNDPATGVFAVHDVKANLVRYQVRGQDGKVLHETAIPNADKHFKDLGYTSGYAEPKDAAGGAGDGAGTGGEKPAGLWDEGWVETVTQQGGRHIYKGRRQANGKRAQVFYNGQWRDVDPGQSTFKGQPDLDADRKALLGGKGAPAYLSTKPKEKNGPTERGEFESQLDIELGRLQQKIPSERMATEGLNQAIKLALARTQIEDRMVPIKDVDGTSTEIPLSKYLFRYYSGTWQGAAVESGD